MLRMTVQITHVALHFELQLYYTMLNVHSITISLLCLNVFYFTYIKAHISYISLHQLYCTMYMHIYFYYELMLKGICRLNNGY